MKTLKCREVSGWCDFVAEGETADEAKEALMKHGEEFHSELLEKATDEEKQKMEEKIKKILE